MQDRNYGYMRTIKINERQKLVSQLDSYKECLKIIDQISGKGTYLNIKFESLKQSIKRNFIIGGKTADNGEIENCHNLFKKMHSNLTSIKSNVESTIVSLERQITEIDRHLKS